MKRALLTMVVLAFVFCACALPAQGADKKPEVTSGVIHFPENGLPEVELSKIKFRFPADTPAELLAVKGKIFRGELTKSTAGRRVASYTIISYIIPVSYNSNTKDMTVFIVQDKGYGKEYESKSVQGWLKGPFDGQNGSPLKWMLSAGNTIMTQEYRLTFLKDGKLRILRTDGMSGDYTSVGDLPPGDGGGSDTAS
jgi:hypothetical protein